MDDPLSTGDPTLQSNKSETFTIRVSDAEQTLRPLSHQHPILLILLVLNANTRVGRQPVSQATPCPRRMSGSIPDRCYLSIYLSIYPRKRLMRGGWVAATTRFAANPSDRRLTYVHEHQATP